MTNREKAFAELDQLLKQKKADLKKTLQADFGPDPTIEEVLIFLFGQVAMQAVTVEVLSESVNKQLTDLISLVEARLSRNQISKETLQ